MPYPRLPFRKPQKLKHKKPRGRPSDGGSMKSHTTSFVRPLYSWDGSNQPVINQYRPAFIEQLTCPAMNPGNFRDPTAWSYDAVVGQCWSGMVTQQLGSGVVGHFDGPLAVNSNFSEDNCCGVGSWDALRSTLYNQALSRVNEKIRGSLDLGLALAEAGATGRMLAGLGRFAEFIHGMRSGNVNPFGGGTIDLANGWLQFQYGWRPLLGDIFRAADESIRIVINQIETVSGHASQSLGGTMLWRTAPSIFGPSITSVPYRRLVDTGRQSCRIVLRYNVGNAFDIARWSSLNPISIAWEVIPYSFVVDWFVDVSSYIRNFETALLYSSRFVSGYVSEMYGFDAQGLIENFSKIDPGSGVKYTIPYAESHTRRRTFARSVLTSHPLPRAPSFQAQLGWQRYLSAAALVGQLFGK